MCLSQFSSRASRNKAKEVTFLMSLGGQLELSIVGKPSGGLRILSCTLLLTSVVCALRVRKWGKPEGCW